MSGEVQLTLPTAAPWPARAAAPGRIPARLAPFLREALRDPRFAELWRRGGHGRAYAAACLAMYGLRKTSASGRRARYDAFVTRRRRELLSELAGAALGDSALTVLGRCAWAELSGSTWRRLLRLVSGEALLKMPVR